MKYSKTNLQILKCPPKLAKCKTFSILLVLQKISLPLSKIYKNKAKLPFMTEKWIGVLPSLVVIRTSNLYFYINTLHKFKSPNLVTISRQFSPLFVLRLISIPISATALTNSQLPFFKKIMNAVHP